MIDLVGGPLGHTAPTTRGAKGAALAGERDQTVVVAVVAMQPREAVGHIAAGHEALELPQDEARQAATRGLELIEEDGQTLPHDLVEQIAPRSSVLDGGGHDGHPEQGSSRRAKGEYRPFW